MPENSLHHDRTVMHDYQRNEILNLNETYNFTLVRAVLCSCVKLIIFCALNSIVIKRQVDLKGHTTNVMEILYPPEMLNVCGQRKTFTKSYVCLWQTIKLEYWLNLIEVIYLHVFFVIVDPHNNK